MKKKKYTFAAVCFTVFTISSCDTSYFDKEIENFNLETNAQVPIGFATYKLSELFKDLDIKDIKEDPNSNLFFSFDKQLNTTSNDAFNVTINDINISTEMPTTKEMRDFLFFLNRTSYTVQPQDINIINTSGQSSSQTVESITLSQQLTAAELNGGTLKIDLASTFNANVAVVLTIPSIKSKSNGTAYSKTVSLTNSTKTNSFTIDLSNYNVDFTHNGTAYNQTNNTIVLNAVANLTYKAGDVIAVTDKISVAAKMTNTTAQVVYGDFKQTTFGVNSETILFDFFNDFADGKITFNNPIMTLTASSKYGFPIGIDLSAIEAQNGAVTKKLTYSGTTTDEKTTPNLLIIDGLQTYFPSANAVSTTRVLNKTNSNIVDLLGIKPKAIKLNFTGKVNPINKNPNLNFYSKNFSALNANLNIQVPLDVKFENVEITKAIDFKNGSDLNKISNVALFIKTENKIPLSVVIEIEFYQGTKKMDISKTLAAFDAADVDTQGKSTGYKTSYPKLELNDSEIQKIILATQIKAKIKLNSPTSASAIKLLGTDDLKISLGAKVVAKLGDK